MNLSIKTTCHHTKFRVWIVTVYRPQIHISQQELALWRLVAASDARPADTRWFWTGMVFTGCRGTCWLRISLTCSNRSPAGETDQTQTCTLFSFSRWKTRSQGTLGPVLQRHLHSSEKGFVYHLKSWGQWTEMVNENKDKVVWWQEG